MQTGERESQSERLQDSLDILRPMRRLDKPGVLTLRIQHLDIKHLIAYSAEESRLQGGQPVMVHR